MYKKFRKSVAEAITNQAHPEQFEWNKWLKEPQIFLERFPKPRIDVKNIETFGTFSEPTLYQVKKFALTKFKVSEEIKSIVIKKRKTFKIFLTFPKTVHQKLPIFNSNVSRLLFELSIFYKNKELFVKTIKDNKESVTNFIPKIISKKLDAIKIQVKSPQANAPKVDYIQQDCSLMKPSLLDFTVNLPSSLTSEEIFNIDLPESKLEKKYLAVAFNKLDKKPLLKNIEVLTLDTIKAELQKSDENKILSFPIKVLDILPKQYKVKIVNLEKVRVPLFHLKRLQIEMANQKLFKFDVLEKRAKIGKNILSQFEAELKPINPEIVNQVKPIETEEAELKLVTPEIVSQVKPKETEEVKLKLINPEIVSQAKPKETEEVKLKVQKAKPKKETTPSTAKKAKEKAIIFSWEKIEADFQHLLTHQKDGVKFFLTNKTAMLCDELGIDKKDQVIYALNAAIKYGVIKNALIVCPDSHVGNRKVSEQVTNSDGWENQIFKINPNLSFQTIRGNGENKNFESFKDSGVYIINYKTLIEFANDSSNVNFNKIIDCLILDEAQYLLNSEIQPELLFNFPHSKYRWILTSLPSQIIEERLVPKLISHIAGFEKLEGYLNRTKESVGAELPNRIRNDFWHELDIEQAQEYENTLLLGRKRIADLVKGGNPFIIQSNIFTLIHQIKQLGNFSGHKETSPKSELLLDQLESIIASGQKSIIFSQYDKQGIQKIERLLKTNQIKYVLYQSGMPLKELENSANSFRKESKISVMLAGLTAASVKIKIPEASYLIHFDQWWNPINQWQYEDKSLNLDDGNQSLQGVNVINYYGNNSVEINIRKTLQKKGLLIKNLVEFLSNETIYSLISNEDWLDILGIEHTRSRKNALPDIEAMMNKCREESIDEIEQKVKLLFTKFGYKNLILKPDILHEETKIYGVANKSLHEIKIAILCLPFKVKDVEPVQNFIEDATKHNSRIFVVCSDEIVNQITPDPHERVTYIGLELFVTYLAQFKIS